MANYNNIRNFLLMNNGHAVALQGPVEEIHAVTSYCAPVVLNAGD